MTPVDAILRWGCIAMIALYASNLVADLERLALAATLAERLRAIGRPPPRRARASNARTGQWKM